MRLVVSQQEVRTAIRKKPGFYRYLPLYISISPFYILFAIFGLFPVAFSLYLAFQKWDGIGTMQFVGWNQFAYLLSDRYFWLSLVNTLEIWLLATLPMLALGLIFAFLLGFVARWRLFYQIIYLLPHVTSVVAITIIFGSLFGNHFGLLNALLNGLGLHSIAWLNNPLGIKVAIATMIAWRGTGYYALIYLAGLQGIPSVLYEAARIDGARTWHIFWHITLPLLR
ncbi:MAG: sugar ABC transporter permease, partial [Ktedonobacteraceae bacterium]|nr:sugar ABC transporter permease [Ktedonobacteraceae bacterium]